MGPVLTSISIHFCICNRSYLLVYIVISLLKYCIEDDFLGTFENENCSHCYLCFDSVQFWLIDDWQTLVNEKVSN